MQFMAVGLGCQTGHWQLLGPLSTVMLEADALSGAPQGQKQPGPHGMAGVINTLPGLNAQAIGETMTVVLAGQPIVRPHGAADPFQVLQQLAVETPASPPKAPSSWLLVPTELAAHQGAGTSWCTALAAFRCPLVLVVGSQPGWEGRARAYGALAHQSRIPLLGVASHGEPHAPHFDPATDLGLPWLGSLPVGRSTDQLDPEGLWEMRDRLWFRWQHLCRTEQVIPTPHLLSP